ncbi:MAG: head protein [Clostridiaceae bacterium]|nr:head protein [Clostridiaceae bacterium]
MMITPQNLRGIYVGFNTIFNKALGDYKPLYPEIATVTPSTTDTETYAWLGDIPGMREWIGEREIQNLTASEYTIKNKSYEATIGIDRDVIEDDRIRLWSSNISALAQNAAKNPDKLIFRLLAEGFTSKCFDGKPFFSDAHKTGGKTVSNMSHAKLSLDAYIAARASMMSLTNSKGEPLALVPDKLVVPPALEKEARDILVADFINGTKNTMQGTAKPLVAPQLAGHDSAWFLLCTTQPVKPLIYQERKKPKFVSKTNETDDNVFMSKQFLYGVDARGNAGYGFWQMAYGSDGKSA